jgi:hypothetical protein
MPTTKSKTKTTKTTTSKPKKPKPSVEDLADRVAELERIAKDGQQRQQPNDEDDDEPTEDDDCCLCGRRSDDGKYTGGIADWLLHASYYICGGCVDRYIDHDSDQNANQHWRVKPGMEGAIWQARVKQRKTERDMHLQELREHWLDASEEQRRTFLAEIQKPLRFGADHSPVDGPTHESRLSQ